MGSQEPEVWSRRSTLGGNEEEKEVKAVDWAQFHNVFYELGDVGLKRNELKARKAFLSEKLEALTEEADRLLNGEGGHGRLNRLRKQLDARRRQMVGQVASLYPLATCTHSGTSSNSKQNHQAVANSPPSVSDDDPDSRSTPGSGEKTSVAIAGLQLVVPVKKPTLFNDKSDLEASATALGYVAHVVTLVASYLDVPLRYPVRLGGSRSYIQDYSPPAEPIAETGAIVVPAGQTKPGVEFPLFPEN